MRNLETCCSLIRVLQEAALNIEEDYFRTKFAESQSGDKYRERIYTYELYHQLRLMIENSAERLVIHGEMDKRAHANPDIQNKIPDLIIHTPGTHANNRLVVEVKSYVTAGNKKKVKEDLKKLLSFTREIYPCGVFLVFGGEDRGKLHNRVKAAFQELRRELEVREGHFAYHPERLWIMWHQSVGKIPEVCGIMNIIFD